MEALDRVVISHNWITIIFVSAMLLLFALKLKDQKQLSGYTKAFFMKGFVEKKAEEKLDFFSLFNFLIFIFSTTIVSLTLLIVIAELSSQYLISFSSFKKIFGLVFVYFLIFIGIDLLVSSIFQIKNELKCFVAAKIAYLYNVALWTFPLLIITIYGFNNAYILTITSIALLLLSIMLVFINNKKLIVNKLFYFILYICALEIAPFLIFYKITI